MLTTKRDGDECRAGASRMPVFNDQAEVSPPHHALFWTGEPLAGAQPDLHIPTDKL